MVVPCITALARRAVLSIVKPVPLHDKRTLLVKLVPDKVNVLVTGVPTVVLKFNEVGLTVSFGVTVAVPETFTVLLSAERLETVMTAVLVPDEVGL